MDSSIFNLLRKVLVCLEEPGESDYKINRVRPPGAVQEKAFMALCIRCNRCLEVCPYHSIKRAGLGTKIGTPFIWPESKGCYLCMACCRLCPTGALERDLRVPAQVSMGKAKIDPGLCYSHLFMEHDVLPMESMRHIGALCNTCYNVCPLQETAILLKDNLYPMILDGCVGCGICVERCPTRPRRAVEILPTGMGRVDEAGFYFRKAKTHFDLSRSSQTDDAETVLKGESLLDKKSRIKTFGVEPSFVFPYDKSKPTGEWE